MIARRDPRLVLLAVVIVVLAGATAFGLWHVIVGGLVNGNGRAGGFGLGLAVVAGSLLAGAAIAARRLGQG